MDFEFNETAAAITLVFWALFALMVWKISTWDVLPFAYKMILTLAMPIPFYFMALHGLNK